jgi:hypothetical protein
MFRQLGLLAAALILVAVPATAGMMLLGMGGLPGGGYTPLCGGSNPTCAYAYSTERKLVSTATTALQVERSVDSTTQDVGFTSTGRVNTATVDAFCNASVGGVISRNCLISKIYDQSGNGCVIYNSSVANMPNYMVDPEHSGLPRFQKAYQGPGGVLTFLLDSNGGVASPFTGACTLVSGGTQSLFMAGSSLYTAFSSGQFGLMENTHGATAGTMWAAFIGPPEPGTDAGYLYDKCINTLGLNCGGLDTEAQGPQANYTRTANDDVIDIATSAGSTGPVNIWMNNVQITTAEAVPHALVTQHRMTWGTSGDASTPGPSIGRTETFYALTLSSGQVAALYSNETTFTAGLTTTYQGPGDVVGGETSYSTGPTDQEVVQMQWLSQCFSLRKCYAAYEGPALNVCQGSGSCEDIGWVNNAIDTATMSAFCGPVSGHNNCAVQIWYNEALNIVNTTNGVGTGIDATAVSSSNRPAVLWSGCGTTAITVCIQTSAANYFTTNAVSSTSTVGDGGYSMSAVAQRTGGTAALSALLSSASTPATFIGFAASANTCAGSASTGGTGATAACNDNALHSITVDAVTSPSKSIKVYVDGTAGTAVTGLTPAYGETGLGVGATGAGLDSCICQLSEVLFFVDNYNAAFNAGLGVTGVANLRANQRAVFGF